MEKNKAFEKQNIGVWSCSNMCLDLNKFLDLFIFEFFGTFQYFLEFFKTFKNLFGLSNINDELLIMQNY
jgi:hypothetical protein